MRIISALALIAALLFCSPADAARGFGTTFGVGSTDAISSPLSVTLNSKTSYSIWTVFNGTGFGGFGTLFNIDNGSVNTVTFAANNNSINMQFFYGRSSNGGDWTFPIVPGTTWQHVCVAYDSSSTGNLPVIYVNGSLVTATQIAAPSGTALTATSIVGLSKAFTGANLWDGKIAEVAMWNGVNLTANQCASLYRGANPLKISSTNLIYYLPLYGNTSGERDWGSSHLAQTITGTLFQPHPRAQLFNPAGN